jgi:hypothetical protein
MRVPVGTFLGVGAIAEEKAMITLGAEILVATRDILVLH